MVRDMDREMDRVRDKEMIRVRDRVRVRLDASRRKRSMI